MASLQDLIIDRSCWFVWNPLGDNPTRQHGNANSAQQEAERLAIENPGQMFFVLAPVGLAYVEPRPGVYRKLSDDDFVPF